MKKILAFVLLFSPLVLSVIGLQIYGYPGLAAGAMGVLLIVGGIRSGRLPLVEKGTIKGANGRNRPLHVIIDPTVPYYKAVLAQEIWESVYKTNPINLIRSRSKKGQREMELMGHEVEVQAAVLLYGVAEASYRKIEAEVMQRGYSGLFRGVDVETEMAKRRKKAADWVRENRSRFA